MSQYLENLKERIGQCNRCGKNRFWHFPTCEGVSGFFGDEECVFVCSQPHEGDFDPSAIRLDKRFYENIRKYGFGRAHLTDVVKCRGEKYKELELWQVRNCNVWLKEEIQIVKPKAIVAVGRKSFEELEKMNLFIPILKINHYSDYFISDEVYEKQFKALRDRLGSEKFRQETDERDQFREFITAINKLKADGKISNEQWHEYGREWRESPHNRVILMQRLTSLLRD